MNRLLGLLALIVLAACAVPPPAPPSIATVAKQCRIGPDDGPVLADRGIGGTGAPPAEMAARNGGDRGIGGTGIVGVITGFASVCVDGEEVAYDLSTPVTMDGATADPTILRAGQVVAVEASGPDGRMDATHIEVLHQVVGPVDPSGTEGTRLHVAGQTVILDRTTRGGTVPRAGDWVAVSGLMDPDGVIHATRLDPAPVGRVLVRGTLRGTAQAPVLGRLALHPPAAARMRPGEPVILSGHDDHGTLVTDRLTRDQLATDPTRYFGRQVQHYTVESYVVQTAGRLTFTGGFSLPDSRTATAPVRAVVSFRRTPHGGVELIRVGSPDTPAQPTTGQPPASAPVAPGGQAAPPVSPIAPRAGDAETIVWPPLYATSGTDSPIAPVVTSRASAAQPSITPAAAGTAGSGGSTATPTSIQPAGLSGTGSLPVSAGSTTGTPRGGAIGGSAGSVVGVGHR